MRNRLLYKRPRNMWHNSKKKNLHWRIWIWLWTLLFVWIEKYSEYKALCFGQYIVCNLFIDIKILFIVMIDLEVNGFYTMHELLNHCVERARATYIHYWTHYVPPHYFSSFCILFCILRGILEFKRDLESQVGDFVCNL